jgi:hypothetical protein
VLVAACFLGALGLPHARGRARSDCALLASSRHVREVRRQEHDPSEETLSR